MSQFFLSLMAVGNSVAFSKMKHPMSMGGILISQTILICLITNNMAPNAWFSYILFLVFLGGMLVLFIYMTSVASNELFQSDNIMSNIMYSVFSLVMMIILFNDPFMMNNFSDNYFTASTSEFNQICNMFNPPYNMITMAAVLYLFLTLIVVVKITEHLQGPLRSKN